MKTVKRIAMVLAISAIGFGMVMGVNAQGTDNEQASTQTTNKTPENVVEEDKVVAQDTPQEQEDVPEEDNSITPDPDTQNNNPLCPYHENCDGQHNGNNPNCDGTGAHINGKHDGTGNGMHKGNGKHDGTGVGKRQHHGGNN